VAVTAAPLTELGYSKTSNVSWWLTEEESAPELRWPLSIDVYGKMRRQDAQVTSVLRAVSMPVGRTQWWIEPNGARDEVVEWCANDLGLPIRGAGEPPQARRTRDRFSWSEHLRLALLQLVFGHSVFEQQYRVNDPDDPRRLHLRKLAWRPPRSICAWHTARDGELDAVEQYSDTPGTKQIILPINRLVVYSHEREGAAWQGNSLLRPAYKHWIIKDRLLRVQAQTIERNGMGIPVYEGAEGESDLAKGLAMAKQVRSGDTSGAATPNGAKLRLMGVEGTLPNADPAIRYHDEQIARAVLAHFLNLGTQTGSWALGTTFADFFTLSLQTVAQDIAEVATAHVVEDLVDVNWGEDEPSPKIGHEEIGARQAATAQAIKLLADAGILLPDRSLEEAIREQHNLPPKDPRPALPAPPTRETEPSVEDEPAGMPAD
jgi:hypothetical protein